MLDARRGIEKVFRVIILLFLPLLIISATPSGGEADKKPNEVLKAKSDFLLTIKDNLISLNAKDSSLQEITEEKDKRMKFDLVTKKRFESFVDTLPAVPPDLEFVFPFPDQVLTGENV